MSRDHRGADNRHVAFAMALRRLELRYELYVHTSPEWFFFSSRRPSIERGVFSALNAPELSSALERDVDAEPQFKVLPS